MSVKISPSILSADFANMGVAVSQLADWGADWVHCDVMDGVFCPNITFGIPMIKAIRKYTDLPLDVHLMIQQPDKYIERFAAAGADIITIHYESDGDTLESLKKIKSAGIKSGLSVKPGTSFEEVKKYLKYTDMLLIMTVEPGFGGQKFMVEMLEKIRCAKSYIEENKLDISIQVDGGINSETSALSAEAGAEIFVAGNYLFKAENMKSAVESLR